ncbi:MAG: trafficking protein particle complex subunit 5 [archaeon]|nr:trafficking protein particle complex subunit 5 [archaeon]
MAANPRTAKGHILDRPIKKAAGEVSLSAFAFLLSEIVSYSQGRVRGVLNLEGRLSDVGYSVGARLMELISWRDKAQKREIKLVGILTFIHSTLWRALFGKPADSLERSIEEHDQYMIIENEMLITRFISVPRDYSNLNLAAFVAGIIHGVLDAAEFPPEKVTAIAVPGVKEGQPKTVILIKFTPAVIARDH